MCMICNTIRDYMHGAMLLHSQMYVPAPWWSPGQHSEPSRSQSRREDLDSCPAAVAGQSSSWARLSPGGTSRSPPTPLRAPTASETYGSWGEDGVTIVGFELLTRVDLNSLQPIRNSQRSRNHVLKYNAWYWKPHINSHTLMESSQRSWRHMASLGSKNLTLPTQWRHMVSSWSWSLHKLMEIYMGSFILGTIL